MKPKSRRTLVVVLALAAGLSFSWLLGGYLMKPPAQSDVRHGDYGYIVDRYGSDIVLFTLAGCPYCEMAREHLDGLQVRYREVPLEGAAADKAFFVDEMGQSGVPVLVSVGTMLVGYDAAQLDRFLDQETSRR